MESERQTLREEVRETIQYSNNPAGCADCQEAQTSPHVLVHPMSRAQDLFFDGLPSLGVIVW